jgi:hypothetical protein
MVVKTWGTGRKRFVRGCERLGKAGVSDKARNKRSGTATHSFYAFSCRRASHEHIHR